MDERIRELAKQATKEVWGNNPHNGAPEFEGYELDQEKFAELIVEECCKIMAEHSHRPAGVVKRNVKEHFNMNG